MVAKEWNMISQGQKDKIEPFLRSHPVKLGALAKELGLSVKLSTMKPGQSGQIAKEGESYVIRINRHETKERQRFTLAHEISHFLLHKDFIDAQGGITDNVLYRSGASEQKEYEANRLAADLIMPRQLVDSSLAELGEIPSDEVIDFMAEKFQVSKAAMEVRLIP